MNASDEQAGPVLLCVNAGSSTLKCALYVVRPHGDPSRVDAAEVPMGPEAFTDLLPNLKRQPDIIAHRIVHGGPNLTNHAIIDDDVLDALRAATSFAPLHLPAELAAIDAAAKRFPSLTQVACLDTAFHNSLPEIARRFPLPERFAEAGLRRFGFHGLSCEYIVSALDEDILGRTIIAHLGSGASLTALIRGQSVDTTMGLTPTGGVIMGTRTGDLDPGLIIHLARQYRMSVDAIERLVTTESGLLGLSGSTNDMRQLLERRAASPPDEHAALAVDAFCRSVRKQIGALTTVLGGMDTLVFTGGIGERSSVIRAEICTNLEHLGLQLDSELNQSNSSVVSAGASAVNVRVVSTDENLVMARHAARLCEM